MKSKIEYSPEFQKELVELLNQPSFLGNELFRVPLIRDALTLDRFKNIFRSRVERSGSNQVSQVTVEHNTDFHRMFFSELSKRPDLISNVLSSLNSVRQNSSRMRVLSVGSRTEAELFSLVNVGFHIDNIDCIDLFSYSPHIKIADINCLPYSENTFDVVVCGWVLEFCSNISLACSEIKRVSKPGGYICIGGMHHPHSTDLSTYNKRKHHEDRVWYCSIEAIREAFSLREEDFVFKSDVEAADHDKRGEVVAIFKNRAHYV